MCGPRPMGLMPCQRIIPVCPGWSRLTLPVSPHIIQARTVIAGALNSKVSSDLPGQLIGHVTQNVYPWRRCQPCPGTGRTGDLPRSIKSIGAGGHIAQIGVLTGFGPRQDIDRIGTDRTAARRGVRCKDQTLTGDMDRLNGKIQHQSAAQATSVWTMTDERPTRNRLPRRDPHERDSAAATSAAAAVSP